ncbi:RDD family protein [Arcobacter vandammei]|uniref:RDD family protein n=1 Tax=Arcobacter vandammei TaxID=2782243 RepID=UPI0018E03DD8|nr:RDD family protein [Arcobacter vandammei]
MQEQIDTSKLELASMRSRAFAFVIDDVIVSLLIMFAYWDMIVASSHDSEALVYLMQTTLFLPFMVLKIFYHTFFVWYSGQTIGKKVAKIRVIDSNYWGRASFFQALFRGIGRVVSEMFFYVGFLIGFFNDGRKTFHDFTGKTLVVNA